MLIHEIQQYIPTKYVSHLDSKSLLYPQVLADVTSISPLYSTIKYVFDDQPGIDSGGIWRAVMSAVFDELIEEREMSTADLERAHENGKFGSRKIDFERLNRENPNKRSVLKSFNADGQTVLVPHYNGFTNITSATVYPRLTDKRSCLYYFGRLAAFCLIYNFKVPNQLSQRFWDACVGGRLNFNEPEIRQRFAEKLAHDRMFPINGSLALEKLYFPLSDADGSLFPYKDYVQVWELAQETREDDFLENFGVPQQVLDQLNE